MSIDADYVPSHPRSRNANGGAVAAKSEPQPRELCETPTRGHCPVSRVSADFGHNKRGPDHRPEPVIGAFAAAS